MGNNYAPNYEIQISDDAQMWQTVKTIIDGQGGNENISDLGNQEARYVRLKLNGSSGSSYKSSSGQFMANLLKQKI
ncbi:MAG: discoidin domain-containing protein [Streptococcus sp.]